MRKPRGIGLGDKIRVYALQEHGFDTIEANQIPGLPVDARTYEHALMTTPSPIWIQNVLKWVISSSRT